MRKFSLLFLCFAFGSLNATVYQPGMWFHHEPTKEILDTKQFPSIAAIEGVTPCQGVFMEYTDTSKSMNLNSAVKSENPT